ncbi:hypothetical protein HDU80_000741 [Chytriomyces hyalinus]|nr:hypothetical protein HDU80_000741 [Chytriomyces hyalinus]
MQVKLAVVELLKPQKGSLHTAVELAVHSANESDAEPKGSQGGQSKPEAEQSKSMHVDKSVTAVLIKEFKETRIQLLREDNDSLLVSVNVDESATIGPLLDALYPMRQGDWFSPQAILREITCSIPALADLQQSAIGLKVTLHPYQLRAVSWMLSRESPNASTVPLFCESICVPEHGIDFVANRFTGRIAQHEHAKNLECDNINSVLGGILADEMGLGKTIEVLALITLHKHLVNMNPNNRDLYPVGHHSYEITSCLTHCAFCGTFGNGDIRHCVVCKLFCHPHCKKSGPSNNRTNQPKLYTPSSRRSIFRCSFCISFSPDTPYPSGATLVITPPSILSQWISETETHSPFLKHRVYKGRSAGDEITARELLSYDIIFTTYQVLQKEIHLARGDNSRSRRHARAYTRPRSPLMEIQWWRVILDEAQMVEGSMSGTSEMARRIPRRNAWCVTGTPFGKSGGLSDLHGLCVFLGLEPFASRSTALKKLLAVENRALLLEFLKRVMYRNSKENVADELMLPVQRQFVVQLDFSAVEASYYKDLFESCMEDLKKDEGDAPTGRASAYARQVSTLKKAEEGKAKMRSWLLQLRQACCHPQIGGHNKTALNGSKVATMEQVLQSMCKTSKAAVTSTERSLINLKISKAHLFEFLKEYEHSIQIYQNLLKEVRTQSVQLASDIESEKVNGAGDMVATEIIPVENGNEGQVTETQETDAGNKLINLKELEHQLVFFIACCHNSLKQEELENQYYEQAEGLRQNILADLGQEVERLRRLLFRPQTSAAVREKIVKLNSWRKEYAKEDEVGGIVVRYEFERLRNVFDRLEEQWLEAVVEWRTKILKLINTKLEDGADFSDNDGIEKEVSEKEPATQPSGEEYNRGAEVQSELDDLMDCYNDVLVDRRELLAGGISATEKAAGMFFTQFHLECQEVRKRYTLRKGESNTLAILKELKHMVDTLDMPDIEREMAIMKLAVYNRGFEAQLKCVNEMQTELKKISVLANARINFFKRLQALSDSVVAPEKPVDVERTLQKTEENIHLTQSRLVAQIGRVKYMEFLSKQTCAQTQPERVSDGTEFADGPECLVCKSPFEDGYITECGHFYCDYCLKLWVLKHRQCALCKQPLKNEETQMTRVKSTPRTNLASNSQVQTERGSIVYAHPRMDTSLQSSIASVKLDSNGSLGSKTDFILRHLLHIQRTDATAKTLIFSQWDQVLNIISMGCEQNGIRHVRFDVGKGKDSIQRFREDPDIKVFMLNAKSQSSGLTLVCATHVFLVEPVVNPNLEMQAINRVHRIGQTKETFVYRYIIKDTIEERVCALVNRRASTNLNAPTKTETSSKGGGEFVRDNDVEYCLFGVEREALREGPALDDPAEVSVVDIEEEELEALQTAEDMIEDAHLTASNTVGSGADLEDAQTELISSNRRGGGMAGRKRRRNADPNELRIR